MSMEHDVSGDTIPCPSCGGTGNHYPQDRGLSMGGGCSRCGGTGRIAAPVEADS